MIRVYLIVGALAAALLGGLLWHDHHVTKRLNEEIAARAKEKADFKDALSQRDERIAIEIENRKNADEASNHYQARARELEDQRTADGFGVIRVCRRPVLQVPGTASSGSAGGSDATAVPGEPAAAEVFVDVGPAADVYGTRCERNTIQLEELQSWVLNRKQ